QGIQAMVTLPPWAAPSSPAPVSAASVVSVPPVATVVSAASSAAVVVPPSPPPQAASTLSSANAAVSKETFPCPRYRLRNVIWFPFGRLQRGRASGPSP